MTVFSRDSKKEINTLGFKNYVYEVKRGENNQGKIAISNEDAGLALLAMDLGEPWSCHQKYKVMDDSHSKIFGRSDVTGAKILIHYSVLQSVSDHLHEFEDELFGHYTLTKYFLAYALSEILKDSTIGKSLISNPPQVLFAANKVDRFLQIVADLTSTTIIDLSAEVAELEAEGEFDYKRDLKSPKWCRAMGAKLNATYKKDVLRKKTVAVDVLLDEFQN